MTFATVEFDKADRDFILYLADFFDKKAELCAVADYPPFVNDNAATVARIDRLGRLGLVKIEARDRSLFRINGTLLELADQIRNPPKRNHWNEFVEKWFSKRWSVPVMLAVVLVPVLAQYAEWAVAVWQFFTSPK